MPCPPSGPPFTTPDITTSNRGVLNDVSDFRMLFNHGFKALSIDGPVCHLQI